LPYDRQYVGNLIKWSKTEVVGLSPLALRLEELVILLSDMSSNKLNNAQDMIDELRQGLEEMRRQRRHAMSLQVSGSKVRRDPNYLRVIQLLTNNPSIPDRHREWAISHIQKGETYA
jgi:hypothetical protein